MAVPGAEGIVGVGGGGLVGVHDGGEKVRSVKVEG